MGISIYIILAIATVLGVWGIYQEYCRKNKLRLGLRVIAVLIAVAAFTCLVLPLSYHSKAISSNKSAILLTPGYKQDSLPNHGQFPVYTLDSAIHASNPKARLINSISSIDTNGSTLLHVFGYGLSNNELKELPAAVSFHPAALPSGITSINLPGNIIAGQQLHIQGTYRNTSNQTVKLILYGLGTPLDSVNIFAAQTTTFNVYTAPKHTGRTVYTVKAWRGKDTIEQEQLPVIVNLPVPLKILMLSASPSFEQRFLREWLSNNGYILATRSSISKNKYSQDFINMHQANLSRLTPALLEKFDAVISDMDVLKSLSPAENAALQQQVVQKGLGIIVRADSAAKNITWFNQDFQLVPVPEKLALSSLLINGSTAAKLNTGRQRIAQANNIQPLVADEHGNLLAAATLNGAGKIIYSTIANSYTWMLNGNKNDYYTLWQALINKAARRLPAAPYWTTATRLPAVGEAVTLHYQGMPVPTGPAVINHLAAAPAQNAALPFEQQFTCWPANYGWQQAQWGNGQVYWWFAWCKNNWQTLKAAQKLAATASFIAGRQQYAAGVGKVQQNVTRAVPKIYFYVLLLIAMSFLWAEHKYAGY